MKPGWTRTAAGWAAAGVLGAAAVWWIDRTPVRTAPVEAGAAFAGSASGDFGAVPIDFEMLARTQPDAEYNPIYLPELSVLDGREVRLRGFMTPYDDLENLQVFMVMGFPTGCNFCAPPAVNQVVLARQPERSRAYAYVDGPIEVTGRLTLWRSDSTDPALRDEQFLYLMTDVAVKPVPASAFRGPGGHAGHGVR